MKTILLLPNERKDHNLAVTRNAAAILHAMDTVCLLPDEYTAYGISDVTHLPRQVALEQAEMIITIGGDGTLLQAAPLAQPRRLPILGINAGNVGFLTEIERNELHLLTKLPGNDFTLDHRMLLDSHIAHGHKRTALPTALNDVVVTRGVCGQAILLDLLVDDRILSRFTCDGMIAATPTGSTGYSMSAGGPVLEPTTNCIAVTPVCPHELYAHSFVLSAERPLAIRPRHSEERPALVSVDGARPVPLEPGAMVVIRRSDHVADICRLKDRGFYDIINEKLRR